MSTWISVDIKPTENDWPIVCASIENGEIAEVDARFNYGWDVNYFPQWVTHWMPLPEPPK